MSRPAGRDRPGQRCAAILRELAVPVPFELSAFRACIEKHTGRAVGLIPAVMEAGAPSGVWLRTARADYFFYEELTSPFHQAHIVLCLAARMLLGDGSGPPVDRLLIPDVRPELVRLMLGTAGSRPVTRGEAEAFAFLALDRSRSAGCPPLLARRALRRLRPLHSALRAAVPEAVSVADPVGRRDASFRLYQQVIEVRDAALALRPYRDPEVARIAQRDGRASGLSGAELAAAVEAAVLASALRARSAGEPVPTPAGTTTWVPSAGACLRTEAACMAKVSRAFARLPRHRERARTGISERGARESRGVAR